MNYLNVRLRSLRNLAAAMFNDLRETVTHWQLGRVGQRALGGIPRPSRQRGREFHDAELDLDGPALASRILRHVDACVLLQTYARELDICPDALPAFRELAREADELAFTLALIPNFDEISQIARAHAALTDYWSSAWASGVSDSEYRCTLKGAALFLRQQGDEAPRVTLNIADDRGCGIMRAY